MVSDTTAYTKGLEDIVAAESSICLIDAKNIKLLYRGYDTSELCAHSNFEETAYLLLYGQLPTESQLSEFRKRLASERVLPAGFLKTFQAIPSSAHPMGALRTGVSLLAFSDPEADDKSVESNERKAVRLLARIPALVAGFDRLRKGLPMLPSLPDPGLSTAAHFLYLLKGKEGSPLEVKMLDKYFVLLAEHDLNASTFACRITASTQSDIYSAVTSAIAALKGDLHGSANSRAMESFLEIGEVDRVEAYLDDALAKKKKLMGFGHRVYKTSDPRALDLAPMAKELVTRMPEHAKWYAIAEKLERLVLERKKLYCNVDFYSAIVLYAVGIPVDLFTPMFAISRTSGWTAHYLEQLHDNRLIRPISHYTGEPTRSYVPIRNRS